MNHACRVLFLKELCLKLIFFLKVDLIFSNAQTQIIGYQNNDQDYSQLLRQNSDLRYVHNLLVDYDKSIYSLKPLIGVENIKMVCVIKYTFLYLNLKNNS